MKDLRTISCQHTCRPKDVTIVVLDFSLALIGFLLIVFLFFSFERGMITLGHYISEIYKFLFDSYRATA
jgi:hypothetical protein